MPVCKVCNEEFQALDSHIRIKHKISAAEYLERYPGSALTDEGLIARRSEKRDAVGANVKMMFTFAGKYEGGHPMRDPTFVENYKTLRALDPHYDREAAKATSLRKHGVEFYAQTDAAREVSRNNMIALNELGLSYAGKNKIDCPNEASFVAAYNEGIPMGALASTYGVSIPTVQRWVSALELPERTVIKSAPRDIKPPAEIVRAYLNKCLEQNSEISFYSYGVLVKAESAATKLKRLFNKGGRLESLKSELSDAYKTLEAIDSFLVKVEELTKK